jgi:hypothetical protein
LYTTECNQFLVPTVSSIHDWRSYRVANSQLDIDLAWHTHQLQGDRYRADTKRYVGQFLHHNDQAGGGRLSDGLRTTARLWKEQYTSDYLY